MATGAAAGALLRCGASTKRTKQQSAPHSKQTPKKITGRAVSWRLPAAALCRHRVLPAGVAVRRAAQGAQGAGVCRAPHVAAPPADAVGRCQGPAVPAQPHAGDPAPRLQEPQPLWYVALVFFVWFGLFVWLVGWLFGCLLLVCCLAAAVFFCTTNTAQHTTTPPHKNNT